MLNRVEIWVCLLVFSTPSHELKASMYFSRRGIAKIESTTQKSRNQDA
jgi:hypothetical protein